MGPHLRDEGFDLNDRFAEIRQSCRKPVRVHTFR
jgi:hypothetical protein